jgi:hypothetical protein
VIYGHFQAKNVVFRTITSQIIVIEVFAFRDFNLKTQPLIFGVADNNRKLFFLLLPSDRFDNFSRRHVCLSVCECSMKVSNYFVVTFDECSFFLTNYWVSPHHVTFLLFGGLFMAK